MATYTYTVFDANPNSSSGTEWPSHSDIEIEADSDEEAIDDVRDVMSVEAAGLNAEDGYSAGDVLHALVWSEDGTIIGTPTYTLTAEDMGEDDEQDTDPNDSDEVQRADHRNDQEKDERLTGARD